MKHIMFTTKWQVISDINGIMTVAFFTNNDKVFMIIAGKSDEISEKLMKLDREKNK